MDTRRTLRAGETSESQYYLTSISLGIAQAPSGGQPTGVNPTEIKGSVLPATEEAKWVSLERTSDGRWEALCFMEIVEGVEGIEFVVKRDETEDVGRVQLEFETLRATQQRAVHAYSQIIDTCDASLALTASYEVVEISSDPNAIPDHVLTKLDEYAAVIVLRHTRTLELDDILEAVSVQQRAVQLTPEDDAKLSVRLSNLGRSITLRYDYTSDEDDLDEAVSIGRKAVEIASEDDPALPEILSNLSLSLRSRFGETEELEDITEAISALERAVRLVPEDHAELPLLLNSLADSFGARLERSGDVSDLSEIVSCKRRVVSLTPEGHKSLPSRLNTLANSLPARYERLGEIDDIAEAIAVHRRLVQLTPDNHPNLHARLNNFGTTLQTRFQRSGELCDINEAISVKRKAVELTPHGHPYMPTKLSNLGNSLLTRFERSGDLHDITEAISIQRESVLLTKEGDTNMPSRMSNLGLSLTARFENAGDDQDIADAVSSLREAVRLTPEDSEDFPSWLNNLGIAFLRSFEHAGRISDIDEAIAAQKRAIHFTPQGHAYLPTRLNNLGNSLTTRFERSGELQDITEGIAAQEKSVELTPEGHAYLPSRLTNLGNSLSTRFELTNDLRDIAEAISAQQRAVQLTPNDHVELPTRLNNLGNAFATRFEHTEENFDIDEAISVHKRAIKLTPERHTELSSRLNSLGTSYTSRFQYTGELWDIREAVSSLQKAVDLTSEGDPDLSSRLNNLGYALQSRFEQTNDASDVNKAVLAQRRAVQLTPDDHAELPYWLYSLGKSLASRYARISDPVDLDEAIVVQLKAVRLTPDGHGQLADQLEGLAQSLHTRSKLTSSRDDLDESIGQYKLAATSTGGATRSRLSTATSWGRLLNEYQPHSPDIILAFDIAIEMMLTLAGFANTVKRRYTYLQDFSGLPQEAAAAAYRLGHPRKAVEWLEQGRCLVWGQLNALRTPFDAVRMYDSDLAQNIATVAKSLEAAGASRGVPNTSMSTSEKISLEAEARAHLTLAKEWDDLVKTVRAVPGFDNFLQPPTCASLFEHLPASGPVVVINVYKNRCDAIVLMAGRMEPQHVPLPNFSLEKATSYRTKLGSQLQLQGLRMRGEEDGEETFDRALGAYRQKRRHVRGAVHGVLRGLWIEVVKPILDALRISKLDHTAGEIPLRIWWCPTGPLSFLPLHASGIYGKREPECLVDYAVSSYIPTVNALTGRVKTEDLIDEEVSGLFLTCQPKAPRASLIPGTTREVVAVFDKASLRGLRVMKLEGSDVDVDGCLEKMETFSSIHLACHATQNSTEFLQSRFLFHTGSLSLDNIMKKNLKNADLAFLSACQTSTGEETLSDEAVHLAAGMLAAGYRRVVATMWAIGDHYAPEVATDFYQYLWDRRTEGCGGGFDGSQSAYALHYATQELRSRMDDSEKSLLTWVPYVHFGY